MVAEARQHGLELTGPNGLLRLFTKNVLETALNEEMTEHLGHDKNRAEPGRESMNVRNDTRAKTVISDTSGEVEIEVPRDRESTFEPVGLDNSIGVVSWDIVRGVRPVSGHVP